MEITLFIISGILLIAAFIGCLVPVIPGVPMGFIGLVILHFTETVQFSSSQFILFIVLTIIAQLSDYILPIWFTKKFGGSRWGVVGSTIGLIAGFFFGPIGIILGPIIGAFVGELITGKEGKVAVKASIGSFIGFLCNTGIKLIVCGIFIWTYFKEVFFQ